MATKRKITADPWSAAARKRLSASRREGGKEPKGFYLNVDEAFAAVGGTGPAPANLVPEDEDARAMRFRFISWKTASGRIFTEEAWNPLIALWTARADWSFVFDRLLTADGLVKGDLAHADGGGPWYGVRRYLHAASDAAFAQALERVRPTFESLLEVTDTEQWDKIKQRDFMAFAFDRAGLADQVLRRYVDGEVKYIAQIGPLVAATTDAELARAAAKKYGSVGSDVYFVFDLVESQGAAALPLLAMAKPFDAPEKKRVAQAVEIAEALK